MCWTLSVVLTVGNDDLIGRLARLMRGTPREALLEDGEGVGYYYKFRTGDLQALLTMFFIVEKLTGLLSPAFHLAGVNEEIAYFLERVIDKLPISRHLGNILLAECHRGSS